MIETIPIANMKYPQWVISIKHFIFGYKLTELEECIQSWDDLAYLKMLLNTGAIK